MSFLTSPHLSGPDLSHATIQRIHADWAKQAGADVRDYEWMYQDHLANLRSLLSVTPTDSSKAAPPRKGLFAKLFGGAKTAPYDPQAAYRFAMCFASAKYLTNHGGRQAAHQQLALIHDQHLVLIDQLLDLPDATLTQTPPKNASGTLGEAVQAALHVYFYHPDYGPQGQRLRGDASLRIPKLLTRFPYLNSNLTVSLLALHPDLIPETARLIQDALRQNRVERGALGWMAQGMTGLHANREDPLKKHGPKIMAKVLEDPASWTPPQLAALAQTFALDPLGINIPSQQVALQEARDAVARTQDRLANIADTTGPLSPQQAEQAFRKQLKRQQQRAALIETDFDGHRASCLNAAAKYLATAAASFKTVQCIAKALPADTAAPLLEVLALAKALKDAPAAFPMPKPSDNRFKDLGLKLMVIEELMYAQKRLLPAFDTRAFAKEWTKREISVEDDGYALIPEVQTYFKNLHIPDDLLAHVEVITQKSGLGGDAMVSTQLTPFWDPGCGDAPVPVTNKAVADLDLLPNLKCVVGLEHEVNAPRPAKLLKALEERGVNTVEEELSLWGKP